jgi:hypothetical protein
LRNQHAAFSGKFTTESSDDARLVMRWRNVSEIAELRINFADLSFEIFATPGAASNESDASNELAELMLASC